MHSLNIKNFTAEDSASHVARDIGVYVLPFVATVQSEPQFLKLLLADEKPMLWHHGQPLQRFAESAWLCKRLGTDVNLALAALERERALLQGQLFDQTLDAYAEHVFHSLRSEA